MPGFLKISGSGCGCLRCFLVLSLRKPDKCHGCRVKIQNGMEGTYSFFFFATTFLSIFAIETQLITASPPTM